MAQTATNGEKSNAKIPNTLNCGIVMPISDTENCTAEHWKEVLKIISDAVELSGFIPRIVSEADDVGVIHKRIIQNLYANEMVVCDVSCKNANVMFELGMRLAFDKPTIIIKDDMTDYSFDTAAIEHISYPRDLRFGKIVRFKEELSKKISATYAKSKEKDYTTFLKNYGEFKVAELSEKVLSKEDYIIDALADLRQEFFSLRRTMKNENVSSINSAFMRKFKPVLSEQDFKDIIDTFLKMHNIEISDVVKDEKLIEALVSFASSQLNTPLSTSGFKKLIDDLHKGNP